MEGRGPFLVPNTLQFKLLPEKKRKNEERKKTGRSLIKTYLGMIKTLRLEKWNPFKF